MGADYFIEYKNYYCLDLKRPKGWRAEVIIVKSLLNHLRRLKYCSKELVYDVREELPTPRGTKRAYPELYDTQMDELFAYIKKNRYDYYRPIRYMALTGRRVGETTLYKKDDVILKGLEPIRLQIRPEITKTRRGSVIFPQGELSDLIKETLRNNNTKWLFPNRKDRKCWKDGIYKYLKRVSEKVIGMAITPHYLRKRFLTKNIPISMKDAMAISGLEDTKVAMEHYAYTTPEGQNGHVFWARVLVVIPK